MRFPSPEELLSSEVGGDDTGDDLDDVTGELIEAVHSKDKQRVKDAMRAMYAIQKARAAYEDDED
jgi:hypothetical protein